MATSGSVDFIIDRNAIIKMAFQKIGIVGEGGTPTSDQYTEAALQLNAIVKSWNATLGMPLWALDDVYILPVTDTNDVLIGASGGHATESYVSTTLSAAAADTDTTITVTATTGIDDTYNIGIQMDDGTMHWTTVNGALVGSVVTLTDALDDDAASGNRVYCYQTKAPRPLRLTKAYARDISNNIDVPVEIITSHEYMDLSNKSTESNYPLKLTYEARIDRGLARLWPRWGGGNMNWIVVAQYHRPLEDFDNTTDTPDFPQEWLLPLVYELACTIAPNYDKDVNERKLLRLEADRWIDRVAKNDYEEGSISFAPNNYYNG